MKKFLFAALFCVLGISLLAVTSKLNANPKPAPAPPSTATFKVINSYGCPIYVTFLAASSQENCAAWASSPTIMVPPGATITYNWTTAPAGATYGAQICGCSTMPSSNCITVGCPPCYPAHAGPIQPPCCGQMQADWLSCTPVYTVQVHP